MVSSYEKERSWKFTHQYPLLWHPKGFDLEESWLGCGFTYMIHNLGFPWPAFLLFSRETSPSHAAGTFWPCVAHWDTSTSLVQCDPEPWLGSSGTNRPPSSYISLCWGAPASTGHTGCFLWGEGDEHNLDSAREPRKGSLVSARCIAGSTRASFWVEQCQFYTFHNPRSPHHMCTGIPYRKKHFTFYPQSPQTYGPNPMATGSPTAHETCWQCIRTRHRRACCCSPPNPQEELIMTLPSAWALFVLLSQSW